MFKKRQTILLILNLLMFQVTQAEVFDHSRWNSLLKAHVQSLNEGQTTLLDYQAMQSEQRLFKQYLQSLSAVKPQQFDRWKKDEQLAFLINAYNAWTVKLILTAWPDLKSIKDLGGFFSSPWSKEFIPLLGKTLSLDDIEHQLIRGSDRYQDPRVHFALNCASIGCPSLRPEAYQAAHLQQQLKQQTQLFLADRSRNRLQGDTIKLSSIFKWYREDFEKGWRGYRTLEDFLVSHAKSLSLAPEIIQRLKARNISIEFLDYDWRLNAKH